MDGMATQTAGCSTWRDPLRNSFVLQISQIGPSVHTIGARMRKYRIRETRITMLVFRGRFSDNFSQKMITRPFTLSRTALDLISFKRRQNFLNPALPTLGSN